MNNKLSIQLIFSIAIIVLTFLIYCNSYLENPGRLYIKKLVNEKTFANSSVINTDINTTIVQSPKVSTIQLPPSSLWHKKNGEGGFGNGRIHSQRRWNEYLSTSPVQIPILQKNFLVVRPEEFYLASAVGSQSHQHCPIRFQFNISNKCNFVMVNLSQLDSVNVFKYDAIISPPNGIERREQEIWNPKINKGPPPIHIYFSQESPMYVPSVNLFRNNNKILASYWSNSDIPVPYGIWVENTNISKYSLPQNSTYYDDKKNYAQGKTKLIAMLVSNCRGRNDRIKYALELRKYMDVDIYGKCSPEKKSCDPNCFKMLKENYKFYLAFENANCRDYITEKFYRNALLHDIIPIVMGAHPEDYKVIAPRNSYIHVEDFASPKALAKYLIKLHKNDRLYSDYFKWKNSGHFVEPVEDFFCRACGMMIYADFQPKPLWSTNSTYKTENKCLQDHTWYWTR